MQLSLKSTVLSPLLLLLSTGLVQLAQAQCCQDACAGIVADILGIPSCFILLTTGLSLPAAILGSCPLGLPAASSACTCLTASASYCSALSAAAATAAHASSLRLATASARVTPTTTARAAVPTTLQTAPTPVTVAPVASSPGGNSPNPFYVFTATTPGYCSVSMVLYLTQVTTYLPLGIATTVIPSPPSSSNEFGCAPLTSTVLVFESSLTLGPADTATVYA